jgi:hypothetical protein
VVQGAARLAIAHKLDDMLPHPIQSQAARGQHVGGDAAFFTEQSEQQVLGPEVIV